MQTLNGDADIPPLLTIAEIAKRFDLPESTARYYCKRFMDYLPHVGDGKRRRYKPETLEIFGVILDEMKRHKDSKSVEVLLAQRFARNVEPEDQSLPLAARPASTLPQTSALERFLDMQTAFMERMDQVLVHLAGQGSGAASGQPLEELKAQLQERDQAIGQLKEEIEKLRQYQFEAERIHQQDLEQLRKWLNHLASRISDDS